MHRLPALIFLATMFLIGNQGLHAQTSGESPFDNLRNELNLAETDSARISIMSKLCTQWGESRPDSGLYYCDLAESLAKKNNRSHQLAHVYWKQGAIHAILGNHSKELELNLKGLSLAESTQNSDAIASGLMMVGNSYYRLNDHETALKYYRRSLNFSILNDNERRSAGTLNNIGNIQLSKQRLDSSLYFFNRALIINQKSRNRRWESINLYNIGKVLLEQNKYEEALEKFRKSEDLKRQLKSRRGEASCYKMIGKTYLKWGKIKQAELSLKKSLSLYESINAKPGMVDTYLLLSRLYEGKKQQEKAYSYYKKYHELNDTLISADIRTQAVLSQQRYELEKQLRAEELALKETELNQQKQLNRRTQIMYLAVSGSIVLLLGGFVAFKRARDQRKINTKLEKVVEQRTEALQTANEELNLFIYKSSHDLKGPLASVQGLVMIAEMEEGVLAVKNYLNMINQKVGQLDTILQRLIDTISMGDGEIEFKKILFPELFEEIKSDLGAELSNSGVEVSADWEGGKQVLSSPELVKGLLFNMVQNAIRFSDPKKNDHWCKIRTLRSDKGMILEVTDNGIGIEPELQNKVWNMFWRGHRDARGSGLGLYIVKKATKRLGGNYFLKSKPGKGTTIWVTIPEITEE